jgi:TonB family protein
MTTEFLIYLAKVALSILLLMGLFKAALAADQSFARNRFYLMGAILWSILIPLLTMQHNQTAAAMLPAVAISPTYSISLPELVVAPHGAGATGSAWGDPTTIILTIYLTGVAIFLLRMMGSYARVIYIIATSNDYSIDSDNIKVTRAAIAPFAFFGWIVFPEKLIDHRDLTKMLLHERVHSRQLHAIDLLLGELFSVFQWFNPASWMLKKLITENHEYTADRAVIDLGVSTYEYQASLVNATMGREVVPVSHFSLILIKKRIKMMNKNRNSAWLRVKSLLVPVAFVAALSLTSFTVELGVNNIKGDKETNGPTTTQITTTQLEEATSVDTVQTLSNQSEAELQEDSEPIFQAAEDMPYFGKNKAISQEEMMKFLARTTIYPKEAAEKGIQGTVYVSFIVNKDGKITNIKTIRSANPILEAEAIRLAKSMPDWTPGKQNGNLVRVVFTMPVKFVLQGKSATSIAVNTMDNALKIVDGKEFTGDINAIDPNNFKSIDVLNGKSATDLYGEKGKNGVLVITLKDGVSLPTTIRETVVTSYN